MCFQPESNEVRNWKFEMERRQTLNKQLKRSGTEFLNHSLSDHTKRAKLGKLERVLLSTDESHQNLIANIRQYFNDDAVLKLFSSEKVKREYENLKREYARSKNEKKLEKQHYEQAIKRNNQDYIEVQQKACKRIEELENMCKQFVDDTNSSSKRHTDPCIASNIIDQNQTHELNYRAKEQRLEETLKTQNILIENLKSELENSAKEIENLKLLNRNLLAKHNSQQSIDNNQSNIQYEDEKRKAQEYKQRLFNLEQRYTELQLLQSTCETDLQIKLKKVYKENASLQNTILEYETQIRKSNEDVISIKLQNKHLERQIVQLNALISNLNKENNLLKKQVSEENLIPVPAPRSSYPDLREGTAGAYDLNQSSPTDHLQENEDEENISYVQESLKVIDNIYKNALRLEKEVEAFSGTKKDKDFLHLQELLIRDMVKLDNVESEGHIIIRESRRSVIRHLQKLLNTLKEKAT